MPMPCPQPAPSTTQRVAASALAGSASNARRTAVSGARNIVFAGYRATLNPLQVPGLRCLSSLRVRYPGRRILVATRKASDVFVECLEAEGVKHVFGIPGEETLDL